MCVCLRALEPLFAAWGIEAIWMREENTRRVVVMLNRGQREFILKASYAFKAVLCGRGCPA